LGDSSRVEHDTIGSVTVPASAYYGAQTQRALDNFRISGLVFPRRLIRALGIVKEAGANSPPQWNTSRVTTVTAATLPNEIPAMTLWMIAMSVIVLSVVSTLPATGYARLGKK
jgi:hypothetical protein